MELTADNIVHLIDLTSEVAPDNLRQAPYSNVPQVNKLCFSVLSLIGLC